MRVLVALLTLPLVGIATDFLIVLFVWMIAVHMRLFHVATSVFAIPVLQQLLVPPMRAALYVEFQFKAV